jgi:8-oxo-dGTP pyrophosphatase MutT (NUDIX family)
VDPGDAGGEIAWAGPDLAEWGRVLDAPPDLARELLCAAVRETFEESGVLLAGPTAETLVADTSGPDWEEDRVAMAGHSLSLADLLGRRDLVLRSDLLHPWARWITPVAEPRRFDTRFFAAALPPGQRTRHVGGEADQVAWLSPAEVIRAARAGELNLMPPTASCLAGLLPWEQVPMALQAPRDLRPVLPVIYPSDDGYWLAVPADVDYPL